MGEFYIAVAKPGQSSSHFVSALQVLCLCRKPKTPTVLHDRMDHHHRHSFVFKLLVTLQSFAINLITKYMFTDESRTGYGIVLESNWMAGYFDVDLVPEGTHQLVVENNHWRTTGDMLPAPLSSPLFRKLRRMALHYCKIAMFYVF